MGHDVRPLAGRDGGGAHFFTATPMTKPSRRIKTFFPHLAEAGRTLPSYELFSIFSLLRYAKRKGIEHPFRFVNARKIKPRRPQYVGAGTSARQ